ncbi:MAG: alanine--tRNA ligase [Bacteroidetes bacterium]|nr:alanine--tRNA ligase [Bacteroidota bacterium]
MDSNHVRAAFCDFFAQRGHKVVPSAPVVNKDDPTLMFVNAGMNPFKDIFTGSKPVVYPRVANSQKCLRVSGKHNDLEDVGHDTYHHTLFEMLGNWSFGDYFRSEAIAWGWEFLTRTLGIDAGRLYVTVFGGDAQTGLEEDRESVEEWRKWVPEDRILRCSKKDNFWEMGETGPCGPCTEIHIDLRDEAARAAVPGRDRVNRDDPHVIEIWNIVLIQFDRKADGSLQSLEMKSVDTGMGLERLCLVMQDKRSTYDTDGFAPLFARLQALSGIAYGTSQETDVAQRVAADHIRALAFTIADGQLPGNTGAGYVVRRLLRRASRYGYRFLNQQQPYLCQLVAPLVEKLGDAYPELRQQQAFITQVIEQEEKAFLKTLAQGTQLFEQYLQRLPQGATVVEGHFAFELYDTYGFPVDLTELMAREKGCTVDMPGFLTAMEAQKARSRQAAVQQVGDWQVLQAGTDPVFAGYEHLSLTATIQRTRSVQQKKGTQYQVVLDRTPFYAESGGQVGDTGVLTNGSQTLRVLDTVKENDLVIHITDRLPTDPTGEWTATVDAVRRQQIRTAHSATHLLHAALRQVLGAHVEQRGSLVQPEQLRFDFSHFQKVEDTQLRQVEDLVNQKIAEQIPLEEFRNLPIDQARAMGAMALFGEKYGERVRVIRFGADYSTELCGGTHVRHTGEIRLCVITSESSIAAGVRRIEALTGTAALQWLNAQRAELRLVQEALAHPKDVLKAIEALQQRSAQQEKQLAQLRQQALSAQRAPLLAQAKPAGDFHYVVAQVDAWNADELKQLAFDLRKHSSRTVFVLGAVAEGKPLLAAILTEDMAGNPDARQLIKAASTHIQGGGGGQDFFATAGGKNPDGILAALNAATAALGVS